MKGTKAFTFNIPGVTPFTGSFDFPFGGAASFNVEPKTNGIYSVTASHSVAGNTMTGTVNVGQA